MTKQKLLGGVLGAVAMDSWEEGKHPRSKDGKFGSGGEKGIGPEPAPLSFHSSRDPKHVQDRKAQGAAAPTKRELSYAESVGHYAKSEEDIRAALAKEKMDKPAVIAHAMEHFRKANAKEQPKRAPGHPYPSKDRGQYPEGYDPMVTHRGNPKYLD